MVPSTLVGSVTAFANAYLRGRDRIVAPHGFTTNEFILLRCFAERGEWTATELTEVLTADASRVSRLVNALTERGLLRRIRRSDDRRVVRLLLTGEGQTVAQDVVARVQEYEDKLLDGVSEEEGAAALAVLSKVLANSDALDTAPAE